VLDALKGYLQLASGLTEVTMKRAQEAASALVHQGLDLLNLENVPGMPGKDSAVDAAKTAASQVQGLADDLMETSKANRELLTGLIRTEVDRTAGRMGFVREEELAAVRRHIGRLENQIADLRTHVDMEHPAATEAAVPSRTSASPEAVSDDDDPYVARPPKKKFPVGQSGAGDSAAAETAGDSAGVDE